MLGLFVKEDPNLRRNREAQRLREQQRWIQRIRKLEPAVEPVDFSHNVQPVYYRPLSQNRFRCRM